MEDHAGELTIEDAEQTGARIGLIFPAAGPSADAKTAQDIEPPKVASHGA